MTLQVHVVSPERIVWSGAARMVTARTVDGGDITFLTGHAPFVGAIQTCKVTIRPENDDDVHFAVHGGFIEVSNDEVSLLSDVAEAADWIDVERATAARHGARQKLDQNPNDEDAVAALRRAELRLEIAGVVPV